MIGGTMGVGKTATCQILKQKLDNSVFLDVNMGIRTADVILRSLARMKLYEGLNIVKFDVSSLLPEQVAEMVIGL